MSTDLVVYGTQGSPFVRKVLVTLDEKGLPWELEEVNVFDPPEWFVPLSPARRIPVLRDRAVAASGVAGTIADSSAICAYLDRRHPDSPVYPSDSFDYARALWFEEYADTMLAARIGFGLLRTLISAPAAGKPPDLEAARKTYHETLPPLFDYLEGEIGKRTYLVGERFSIADIATCAQLSGLHLTRVPLDAGRWPNLARYMNTHLERESFAVRLAALAPIMPKEAFVP